MAKYISSKIMLSFYQYALTCYDQELRPYVKNQFEKDLQKAKSLQEQILIQAVSSNSKLQQWDKQLRAPLDDALKTVRLLDKPFRLFVIGSGNVGKSTVINTLVGEKVAEMGALPKTWRLDTYLGVDNDAMVELHYANQRVLRLPKSEAEKKVAEEDENAFELNERIQKELKVLRQNAEFSEKRKQREKQRLLAQYDASNGLTEVIWPVRKNAFLKNFTLVDTPGMNQTLYNTHIKKDALHYYQEANGILWVLPTDKLSDQQSNADIEQMAKAFQGKVSRTVAILNKWDAAEGEEEETMAEAKRLFGKYFSQLLPYHARADWKEIKNNAACTQETEKLRQDIYDRFYRTSQEIQIHDVEISLQKTKQNNIEQIDEYTEELTVKNGNLAAWKKQWSEITKENQRSYVNQAEALRKHLFERICARAEANESTLQNLDNSRKNDFFEENILHYGDIKRQYEQFETDIIRHMHLIAGQFLEQYTAEIREEKEWFNLDADILPTVRYIISDADFAPLIETIDLSTNKFSNFFRRNFNWFTLSGKIREKYDERFKRVNKSVTHDLEVAFTSYNQQMTEKLERIFADIYFPVQKYNPVMTKLSAYKQFLQNWQVKKPNLLYLLGKEV